MQRFTRIACATAMTMAAGLTLLLPSSQAQAAGADKDSERLKDGGAGVDWAGFGATFGEQHFSPLTQINADTVSKLGLAWYVDLPPGNSVSAPLEVDGVVYFVTAYGVVHAVDVASGKQVWQYDAKANEVAGRKLRLSWGTRGVGYGRGKVFLGTVDGRLIAIDAKTGKEAWSSMVTAKDDTNYITGAPRYFDGKVIMGFGGADVGPTRGYVSTFDADTGKELWRFYTVPGDPAKGFENKAMEAAAKTWYGEWWKDGGGGTAWNSFAYDPDTKTIYIGVGNGTPWNRKARSQDKGDNLYLCSILALDATTGAYKWHYQINPGETWDYTATQDIEFADLKLDGKVRKVLMTAPKNGFFYVIDRVTGQLLSAEPIAKVTWASKIDLKTGRPVENPGQRYPEGKIATVWPSDRGAHNWWPMSFSPKTGLVYIPVLEKGANWMDFGLEHDAWRQMMPVTTAYVASYLDLYPKLDDPLDGTTRLVAWDPKTQKEVWRQATSGTATGSTMATAGNLVFQGQLDGRFVAYDAATGKPVWTFQANAPVLAPPISYSVGGRQYVSVLTGSGMGAAFLGPPMVPYKLDYRTMERRLLTFAIDGKTALPPKVEPNLRPAVDPDFKLDAKQVEHGSLVFAQRCMLCHGFDAIAAGAAPDLRSSAIPTSAEAFANVVQKGALVPAGMPMFQELTDVDVGDARAYLRSRAQIWRDELKSASATKTK